MIHNNIITISAHCVGRSSCSVDPTCRGGRACYSTGGRASYVIAAAVGYFYCISIPRNAADIVIACYIDLNQLAFIDCGGVVTISSNAANTIVSRDCAGKLAL